jgi:hypothetical protein
MTNGKSMIINPSLLRANVSQQIRLGADVIPSEPGLTDQSRPYMGRAGQQDMS